MKTILILTFALIISNVNAQEWKTDITEAKAVAKKENRNIILVFQGSDWCAPCIRLDREIWTTTEFRNYAKDHFVMLKADFPRKKKNFLSIEQQNKNKELAEIYNTNGYFPFVVILDNDGKVLGETSYKKISPIEYIKLLETFK